MRYFLISIVSVILLSSCGSGVIVTHKWNRDADFGRYKTYSFVAIEKLGSSNVLVNDDNMNYIKQAVRIELDLRGYQESDTADMSVKLDITINEYSKEGPTSGEGMILARLVIELKDAETNEMLWWGGREGEALRVSNKREKRINKAVAEIFEAYTFFAGDPIRY